MFIFFQIKYVHFFLGYALMYYTFYTSLKQLHTKYFSSVKWMLLTEADQFLAANLWITSKIYYSLIITPVTSMVNCGKAVKVEELTENTLDFSVRLTYHLHGTFIYIHTYLCWLLPGFPINNILQKFAASMLMSYMMTSSWMIRFVTAIPCI